MIHGLWPPSFVRRRGLFDAGTLFRRRGEPVVAILEMVIREPSASCD